MLDQRDPADGPREESPTLYEWVKRELVSAIARGEYVIGQPFITQKELCERFGVSTTTAVRALNDLVAEGILVRQRGRGTFVTERAATDRHRSTGADRSIAYVMHGPGPHLAGVINGIQSVCDELGYRMFLSDTKRSANRQEHALRQALDSGASGVILYPVEGSVASPALAELRRSNVPMVLVDRYDPQLPSDAVLADNFGVGYRLTEFLLQHGHRRIATLWDETDCTSVRERLTGHVQALRNHGVPVLPEFTLLTSYQQLADRPRRTMLESLLNRKDAPTVLLCANGFVLARVAHDLVDLGLDVPGEVELAGMDDAGPFNLLPLTIAAGVLPSDEMGRRAMRLIADRIDARDHEQPPGQHIVLPVDIRTRESAPGYLRVGRNPRPVPSDVG
jgi:DNA-binding LacI/PurR family transcriptional regulator